MRKFLSIALLMVLFLAVFSAAGLCQQKAATPQYGGTMRIVLGSGPKVLSWFPEMGPADESAIYPAAERIMDYVNEGGNRRLVPFLAESVTVGKDRKSFVIKLKKGIKFHDGSELNAEVVAWNYQLFKDTKRLQFHDKVSKIEIADPYTVVLRLTQYNNMLQHGLCWVYMFSKQSWDQASGGNMDKGKEWARTHVVGTGPFKLAEWKRDNYIRWIKNENYWQKGRPYLNEVIYRYVPDPVTEKAMMQSKEADIWYDAPIRDQTDMEKKGFIRRTGYAGTQWCLIPNNKDPKSPFQDKRVREALEYAIDKAAIAKAIGFGYYTPSKMVAPDHDWGFDPAYKGRTYNPATSKKLLAEAGYPNGLKVSILLMSGPQGGAIPVDAATAIKRYLDEGGFQVDLDVADAGRYFGSLWKDGWKDIVYAPTNNGVNYMVAFERWWSHDPMANFASFKRPPEMIKIAEELLTYDSEAEQKAGTKKAIRYMADEALVVPLFFRPGGLHHRADGPHRLPRSGPQPVEAVRHVVREEVTEKRPYAPRRQGGVRAHG